MVAVGQVAELPSECAAWKESRLDARTAAGGMERIFGLAAELWQGEVMDSKLFKMTCHGKNTCDMVLEFYCTATRQISAGTGYIEELVKDVTPGLTLHHQREGYNVFHEDNVFLTAMWLVQTCAATQPAGIAIALADTVASGGVPPGPASGGMPPGGGSGGVPPAPRSGGVPPARGSGGEPPATTLPLLRGAREKPRPAPPRLEARPPMPTRPPPIPEEDEEESPRIHRVVLTPRPKQPVFLMSAGANHQPRIPPECSALVNLEKFRPELFDMPRERPGPREEQHGLSAVFRAQFAHVTEYWDLIADVSDWLRQQDGPAMACVWCRWGKHRSVSFVEDLAIQLAAHHTEVYVEHCERPRWDRGYRRQLGMQAQHSIPLAWQAARFGNVAQVPITTWRAWFKFHRDGAPYERRVERRTADPPPAIFSTRTQPWCQGLGRLPSPRPLRGCCRGRRRRARPSERLASAHLPAVEACPLHVQYICIDP